MKLIDLLESNLSPESDWGHNHFLLPFGKTEQIHNMNYFHSKLKLFLLKSVHFKETVARSSFLSKMRKFAIWHQLTLFGFQQKITTILKEIRILQLFSKNEQTLLPFWGNMFFVNLRTFYKSSNNYFSVWIRITLSHVSRFNRKIRPLPVFPLVQRAFLFFCCCFMEENDATGKTSRIFQNFEINPFPPFFEKNF